MLFGLLLFWLQSPSAVAQAHAKRGLELLQQGDLRSAEAEFRQAIQLAPNDAQSLASLGIVLERQEKFEEADLYLERALKIDPADLGTRYHLAINQFRLKQLLEAKANLERILKAKPDMKPALLLLGTVLEGLKDYGRAAGLLESVPDLVRQQPAWIATLARCYYHANLQQKARATLDWLRPAGAEAVFLGGETAAQCGDLEAAEQLLDSIRTAYPDKARLGYEIAMVQYNAKRFDRSESTLLQLIAAGTREAKVFNLLSWCYHRQNRLPESIAAMKQAIELEPASETHYDHLAQILLEEGRYADAYETIKRALKVAPDSPRAYKLQGHIESRLGLFNQALDSYTRAVQLNVEDPDLLLGIGLVQQKLFRFTEAAATFEKGIARFPGDAQFYQAYGRMLLEPGTARDAAAESRAVTLLEKALALDNALPEAHYELGNALLERDKVNEALPQLEAAVKLDPRNSRMHLALANAYRRLGRNAEAASELELFKKLRRQEEQGTKQAN
ncbi:MAG: tetratricopeptide repeat protein [Acidobacteriia bacterium]|nr:tetratricopeptide repeat protein [Terriglobia bacterium]